MTFLIWAHAYTHRSSGVRALYRLCHHLNMAGYKSAMLVRPLDQSKWDRRFSYLPLGSRLLATARRSRRFAGRLRRRVTRKEAPARPQAPLGWKTPIHDGPIGKSIVVYPEVVSGNPFRARKVIRWALHVPGRIGGDTSYPDDELVFCYDPQRLDDVNRAVNTKLGAERVLRFGLMDPTHIYPDPSVPKTIDCSFTHKGRELKKRFPLPDGGNVVALEDLTPTMAALGDTLRRTRTLYSYDHYSRLLAEAVICGCDVKVIGADGTWHDPRTCDCALNILWPPGFEDTYAAQFHDGSFVPGFIRAVRRRWHVPEPRVPMRGSSLPPEPSGAGRDPRVTPGDHAMGSRSATLTHPAST